MTDREKLIELLLVEFKVQGFLPPYGTICSIAEDLIANGVTVQPVKVGDTIYETDSEHGVIKHDVYEVCVVFKTTAIDDKGNEWDDYWTTDDIGNAYKTRMEAEANLPQPPKGE